MLHTRKPGLSTSRSSLKPSTSAHQRALRSPSVTVRSMCPKPSIRGVPMGRIFSLPDLECDCRGMGAHRSLGADRPARRVRNDDGLRIVAVRAKSPFVEDVRAMAPDDWRLWRDLRLSALADAPEAFGSSLADWETADERRWRRRLEDVPFNVIALTGDVPVGQASGTTASEDRRVELISM